MIAFSSSVVRLYSCEALKEDQSYYLNDDQG
jgi:hypothetical protein